MTVLIGRENMDLTSSMSDSFKARLIEYQDVFDMLAPNTKKAYLNDMRKFFYWCEENHCTLSSNLGVNKQILKNFFSYLIGQDLARASIVRIKASLSKFVRLTLMPNPFVDDIFREWLLLSLKKKPKKQKQAIALDDKLLCEINNKLHEDDLMQLRDKVLLNIMYDGLLRASELSVLEVHDISFRQKTLFLKESKTDQDGEGSYRALSIYTLSLIKLWKDKTGIVEGYLLRNLTGAKRVTKKPLGYDGVYNAFKRFSLYVEIDMEVFTTHSARVGAAVTMAEHDCSTLDIQRSGGWKSPAMPARYTEQVSIHKHGIGAIINQISR